MTRPITPDEVASHKVQLIPPEVVQVFNGLISKAWNGTVARIRQEVAVDCIASKMGVDRDEVFRRHWLDVEPIFEAAGWTVEYNSPAYNESYPTTFTFRRKRS